MHSELTAEFLTATYAPDYERFCFLRESMERCEVDIPHLAVVQHEDLGLFKNVPCRHKLRIISTSELLPRVIERRRRLWGVRRRNPKRWFGGKPIHGWVSQQLVKLASPKMIDADAIVCLDSDLFFVRRVEARDFFATDGRVHLYETANDLDAEMAEWLGRNMRFIGVNPTQKPLSRFTHWPMPLHRQVLLDLQSHIEKRHGRDWFNAILNFDMLAEYTLYGAYAKYVDLLKRTVSVHPPLTAYFWWRNEVDLLEQTFEAKVFNPAIKIVGIQSNTGRVPADYRKLVEPMWCNSAAQ